MNGVFQDYLNGNDFHYPRSLNIDTMSEVIRTCYSKDSRKEDLEKATIINNDYNSAKKCVSSLPKILFPEEGTYDSRNWKFTASYYIGRKLLTAEKLENKNLYVQISRYQSDWGSKETPIADYKLVGTNGSLEDVQEAVKELSLYLTTLK